MGAFGTSAATRRPPNPTTRSWTSTIGKIRRPREAIREPPSLEFGREDQAGFLGILCVDFLLLQILGELAPIVWGIPDLEVFQCLVREPALIRIGASDCVPAEALAEKFQRDGIGREDALTLALTLLRGLPVAAARCQRDAGAIRKPLRRFDKRQVLRAVR